MALAAPFHLVLGHGIEPAVGNVVIGAVAGFVLWGRLTRVPIAARAGS